MTANHAVQSFAPIESPHARILILGSMPGVASLAAGRYYAHPQNAFWRIVGEILGCDASAPYDHRIAVLRAAGVALWDVLHSCVRPGSLDSAIAADSLIPNDFASFFARHPHIERIGLNGTAAHDVYVRHVQPTLPPGPRLVRLPSTSPANASIPYAAKLAAWRRLFDNL